MIMIPKNMRILSIGGFSGLGESNTCSQRDSILREYGWVDNVDTTAIPFDLKYRGGFLLHYQIYKEQTMILLQRSRIISIILFG